MPQVIVTEGAARGLERCRRVIADKSPQAAERAGQAIERQFLLLESAPDMPTPIRRMRYYSFMEKVAKITGLKEPSRDRAYWLARSPQERLAAVEELRQQYLASRQRVEQRLQRVCRVTQLHRG